MALNQFYQSHDNAFLCESLAALKILEGLGAEVDRSELADLDGECRGRLVVALREAVGIHSCGKVHRALEVAHRLFPEDEAILRWQIQWRQSAGNVQRLGFQRQLHNLQHLMRQKTEEIKGWLERKDLKRLIHGRLSSMETQTSQTYLIKSLPWKVKREEVRDTVLGMARMKTTYSCLDSARKHSMGTFVCWDAAEGAVVADWTD